MARNPIDWRITLTALTIIGLIFFFPWVIATVDYWTLRAKITRQRDRQAEGNCTISACQIIGGTDSVNVEMMLQPVDYPGVSVFYQAEVSRWTAEALCLSSHQPCYYNRRNPQLYCSLTPRVLRSSSGAWTNFLLASLFLIGDILASICTIGLVKLTNWSSRLEEGSQPLLT